MHSRYYSKCKTGRSRVENVYKEIGGAQKDDHQRAEKLGCKSDTLSYQQNKMNRKHLETFELVTYRP
jgi:hypothetical protein